MDVLPAPFGPMIARISPLRMSKETPVLALTPPKASETSSTASSTSLAALLASPGALILRPASLSVRSCRLLQRRGDRRNSPVVDLDPRRKHPLAPVLERHLGRDVGFACAVIDRAHQTRIAF